MTSIAFHGLEGQRPRLLRLAQRLLKNRAEAEDLVQEAYLRALASTSPAPASAQAWLVTVLRHAAIDRLRHAALERERLAQLLAAAPGPAPSAEQTAALALDSRAAVRLLAERLSAVEAAALLLREVFGVGYAELAAATGKAEAACRQLVHRALQRVRAPAPAGEGDERAGDDATQALAQACWRALASREPAGLFALLRTAPLSARARTLVFSRAAGWGWPAGKSARSVLVNAGGQLGLALVLEGRLLCVVPLGPLAPSCAGEPDGYAAPGLETCRTA